MSHPYTITLNRGDLKAAFWLGNRYHWSDALCLLAPVDWDEKDKVTIRLKEHEAWAIRDAIEADLEGNHISIPCASHELMCKLYRLVDRIV